MQVGGGGRERARAGANPRRDAAHAAVQVHAALHQRRHAARRARAAAGALGARGPPAAPAAPAAPRAAGQARARQLTARDAPPRSWGLDNSRQRF